MEITKEQFAEWKEHPVTKEVMEEVKNKISELTERIIDGRTIGQSAEVTHGLTNKIIGQIDGLSKFHDYDFYKYKGSQRIDKIARNLVDYEAGKTILATALNIQLKSNTNQLLLI